MELSTKQPAYEKPEGSEAAELLVVEEIALLDVVADELALETALVVGKMLEDEATVLDVVADELASDAALVVEVALEDVLEIELAELVVSDCALDVMDAGSLVRLLADEAGDEVTKDDELPGLLGVDDAGVELEVSAELLAEVDMEPLVVAGTPLLVEEDIASLEVVEADNDEEELVIKLAPKMWFSLIAGPTELLR